MYNSNAKVRKVKFKAQEKRYKNWMFLFALILVDRVQEMLQGYNIRTLFKEAQKNEHRNHK